MSFRGSRFFLSNFYPSAVLFDGAVYPTSEHAYQAAKTLDLAERERVRLCATAGQAKRLGRKLTVRADWHDIRVRVMARVLAAKFSDPALMRLLRRTGLEPIVETNTWGDTFWGVCDGVGENWLGRLLMQIRDGSAP